MKWTQKTIETAEGRVNAVCPEIVSASRSTDIPAFYPEWFVQQFRQGYVRWQNPFSQQVQYVSFEKTCAFVFWSKNPAPLIPHLRMLDELGIPYYFLFTLNDYDDEGFEPNVPPLEQRAKVFRELSDRLGKERVVWRFDPLIVTDELTVGKLLEKVKRVGEKLRPYTEKLVFSFIDIAKYMTVRRNLARAGHYWKDIRHDDKLRIAEGLAALNKIWRLSVTSCAEKLDLSAYGIMHSKCIDENLLFRISREDSPLRRFLVSQGIGQSELFVNPRKRRNNQRADCGCFPSKDIGRYSTCKHFCVYCYANSSPTAVAANAARINNHGDCI